ncbi:MAG: hypothetical protein KA141_05195 [Rubrivivax sp.]|nr:hypothetical protein [Rubrivivax sp.]
MTSTPAKTRIGLLFSYDWDTLGFERLQDRFAYDEAGFDPFFLSQQCAADRF